MQHYDDVYDYLYFAKEEEPIPTIDDIDHLVELYGFIDEQNPIFIDGVNSEIDNYIIGKELCAVIDEYALDALLILPKKPKTNIRGKKKKTKIKTKKENMNKNKKVKKTPIIHEDKEVSEEVAVNKPQLIISDTNILATEPQNIQTKDMPSFMTRKSKKENIQDIKDIFIEEKTVKPTGIGDALFMIKTWHLYVLAFIMLLLGLVYALGDDMLNIERQRNAAKEEIEKIQEDRNSDDVKDVSLKKKSGGLALKIKDIFGGTAKASEIKENSKGTDELLKSEESFVSGNHCFVGSTDAEINKFFHSFKMSSFAYVQHKTRNYWSKTGNITNRIICISGLHFPKYKYNELEEIFLKKNLTKEEKQKIIDTVSSESVGFYKIDVVKGYLENKMKSYSGCIIGDKETTKKILDKIGVVATDDQLNKDCTIDGNFSFYGIKKDIDGYEYYKLLSNPNQFFALKEDPKYKATFSGLGYYVAINKVFNLIRDANYKIVSGATPSGSAGDIFSAIAKSINYDL